MSTFNFQNELLAIQPRLYSFAYQLTMNRDDAEDLMQETSLKILSNASKFVSEQNFKGWALTIMKNIFINDYRKLSKRKQVNDSSPNEYLINSTSAISSESPEGALSTKEIGAVINEFADGFRVPFMLYVSGYSYQEISDKMNIPLGTVKSRIFFARKKLQVLLKDYR